MSMPMSRRSRRCAPATNGHTAAPVISPAVNSRRRIADPSLQLRKPTALGLEETGSGGEVKGEPVSQPLEGLVIGLDAQPQYQHAERYG